MEVIFWSIYVNFGYISVYRANFGEIITGSNLDNSRLSKRHFPMH